MAIAIEMGLEDLVDLKNTFYWDKLVLNFSYSEALNQSMPWIYKFNSKVKRITCDVVTFIDKIRVTGYSVEVC